jgi:hypothetical protein
MIPNENEYDVIVKRGSEITMKFHVKVVNGCKKYTMQSFGCEGDPTPRSIAPEYYNALIEVASFGGCTTWTNKPDENKFYQI